MEYREKKHKVREHGVQREEAQDQRTWSTERRSTRLENMEYREKKHKVREHGVQIEEAQG